MNPVCSQIPPGALVSLTQPAAAAQPSAEQTPEGRSEEFRAVEGGSEGTDGMTLLVWAYDAFWVLAFGLILMTWRKQRKLDARITQLSADLEKARAEPPTKND